MDALVFLFDSQDKEVTPSAKFLICGEPNQAKCFTSGVPIAVGSLQGCVGETVRIRLLVFAVERRLLG